MRTLIIGEAGLNHNGRLDTAKMLADQIKLSNADVFKTQTAVPELEVSASAPLAPYQAGLYKSQLEMVRALNLSFADTKELARHCEAIGIEFCSTPADIVSLKFLVEECGVKRIKIGSGDFTNMPLIKAARETKLPLILSTGMATEEELDTVLTAMSPRNLTLMQCTSAYPSPIEETNLAGIRWLEDIHGFFNQIPIGFSDHSGSLDVSPAAVAAGAEVIEMHVTLNRHQDGPDHEMSFLPAELLIIVGKIRRIEVMMGSRGRMRPSPSEIPNIVASRKSLVASVDINKGERFTEHNITCKRPGTGISPILYWNLLESAARRDYGADELISKDEI